MKIKAIAIDDEPLALEIVKQYCMQLPGIELIQTFDNAVAGLAYIHQHQPDLLFIDIDMPDINGIDLINSLETKPMIIFTTAYKEFALDGFELEAVDYLLKPFSFERFEKAFQKAASKYKSANSEDGTPAHIFVYTEYRMKKILLQDIIYIESLDDYIKIHLANDKPVMTLMSLKKVSEKLPPGQFIRIHRSYITSVKYLSELSGRKIKLTSGTELPVGERYASEVNKWTKPD
ncbi:MAG TPA: LytTR family DNA-binding domain-containing protein [Niabella sp.]|nr:LytTR family DNA-binding domain-containing protein [Niabella sp.]